MAYAYHSRLTFEGVRGTVAAPRETWACRLNIATVVPTGDGAPTKATLDAIGADWDNTVGAHTTSDTILTGVKWAFIGPDGKYINDPVLSSSLNLGGSRLQLAHVDQVSVVISLNTAMRGARGRGRIFLPGPGVPIGDGSVMSATDAQNIATSGAALLSAINAKFPNTGNVCVASSLGTNSDVTSVRVGRVFDTVRSRRTSLVEGYGANVTVTL